jgi:hypothetical protein
MTVRPDLEDFHKQLVTSVDLHRHGPADVARDFRTLFLEDKGLGRRVLFMLMSWCGEYDVSDDGGRIPPLDPNELQRWAGKREIAARLKAALYADLNNLEDL